MAGVAKQLTLCFVHAHPQLLLGMKKKGFGAGWWNGFGGKVEPGETIEQAARRELLEECGITASAVTKLGVLDFAFTANDDLLQVHIFKADDFSGQPLESDEMTPQWFHVDEIPFESMWPDDRHWIPLMLADKKFEGRFLFGDGHAILEQELHELV